MSFTERLALLITAKADQALRELKKVGTESSALGKSTTAATSATAGLAASLKGPMVAGATIAAGGMAALAKESLDAASDLAEQVSATEQVFGSAADAVLAFGKQTADSIGVSNRAALEASNQFGDLFTNVGVSEANAAKFSTQLVRLAADLASFKNLDPGDVLTRLSSGLVGETEPLRRLGIVINAATVESKAMELGIASASGEVSDAAKVQARYALILESTSKAQGDVARTSDSYANQQRALNAQLEDTKAKLGRDLIPAAAGAAEGFNLLVRGVEKAWPAVSKGLAPLTIINGGLRLLGQRSKATAEGYEQLTAAVAQEQERTVSLQEKEKATATTLKGVADAAADYTESLKDVLDASGDLIDATLGVEDADARLVDAHQAVADKEQALAEARRGNSDQARKAADAARDLADAQLDAKRAAEDSARAVTDAQREFDRAVNGNVNQDDREEAARRLARAKEDQVRSAEDAARRIADAEREMQEARDPGGRDRAIKDAVRDLERARRDEVKAVEEVARSRQELAEQQAAQAGQTLTDAQAYNVYRDSLIRLKDATPVASALRAELEKLLALVPSADAAAAVARQVSSESGVPNTAPMVTLRNLGPPILGSQASIVINQTINGSGIPPEAALEQANRTLGWTVSRWSRRAG